MLRHVFIINVKKGIPDDMVERKMAEMRAMQCCPKRFIGTMNMRLL